MSMLVQGQNEIPTTYGISAGNFKHPTTGEEISTNVGQIIVSPSDTLYDSTMYIHLGLPLGVIYMSHTFGDDLFVSKGFYSDYILLNWTIDNKADKITRFEIYRRNLGDASWNYTATVASESSSWKDEYAESGIMYEYKIIAAGINDVLERKYINFVTGIGFRNPTGTITGRITYEGGNAVKDIHILAETNDITSSYSMYLNGNSSWGKASIKQYDNLNEFTVQGYLRFDEIRNATIFQKEGQFALDYIDGKLVFSIADTSVSVDYTPPIDTFIHVSVVHSENNNQLYVNGDLLTQMSETIVIPQSEAYFFLGRNNNATEALYFKGYIDEIRCWEKALDSSEIVTNYTRYLSGNETGLIAYWRFNDGTGEFFFDISRSGYSFNENHGDLVRTEWSTTTPPRSQLWYKGVSDDNGNYIISGLPYLTNGSTYILAPLFENHEFRPTNKVLFVGDGATTHNNVDFVDISSLPVTGNIVYEGSEFPVKNVYLKVDGSYIQGSDNQPVKTDEMGNFSINVPIGDHYISVEKNGHEFASAFFPAYDTLNNEPNYYTFDKPVSGIQFKDITKLKLSGLLVGGPVEAAKNINSVANPNVNNIGQVKVTLTTEASHVLNDVTDSRELVFTSNTSTGVYEIELLPEKYIVSSSTPIKTTGTDHGSYIFDGADHLLSIDLSNSFYMYHEIDSIYIDTMINNEFVSVYKGTDTVASYNMRRDWVYRSPPSFDVVRDNGSKILCDSVLYYTDSLGITDTVVVAEMNGNSISYPFGNSVFTMGRAYTYHIEAFEEYVNCDDGIPYRVPITDGNVLITNGLASEPDDIVLSINDAGKAYYRFLGGVPNIASPYTKNMNISLQVPGQSTISIDPVYGYLLGSKPTGNNFVTTGPDEISFILRDPPGSNSSSTLEKGFASQTTSTKTVTHGWGLTAGITLSFGPDIKTTAGSPVFSVGTELDWTADIGVRVEATGSNEREWTVTNTTIFNESFSTSDDPAYNGANGDIFIGNSTNIIYGLSNDFNLLDTTDVLSADETGITNGKYTLAIKTGLYIAPEIGTKFIYTQDHIINNLIPNLRMLRNLQIGNTDRYQIVFSDMNDPKFGSNNYDEIWGDEAVAPDSTSGPSYIYFTTAQDSCIDTVMYYNNQINIWESYLSLNEKQKIEALPDANHENISFDAGAIYEASIGTARDSSYSRTWAWSVSPVVSGAFGLTADGMGAVIEVEAYYSYEGSNTYATEINTEQTIGYTLSDGDQGDYFTVDVKKCQSGNGPVFTTKGGQSSCPYEGLDLTQYYQPGQHTLSFATMQIEVPYLFADNPISPELPENKPAVFEIGMANQSEVDADVLYMLQVDPATNPHGAKVYVDGMNLIEGVPVMVPGGETIYKTLEIYKGNPDVDAYEGISVVMSSMCDDDIYSDINLSAYFTPACINVNINNPTNNWTVNASQNDTLIVQVGGYDLQSTKFKDIYFQYRPTGTSMWYSTKVLVNDPALVNKDEVEDTLYINDMSSVNIIWDMSSLIDREYDIRAVSHCDDGTESPSEILTGVLDGKRPKVFGTPQPADGILSTGDDISIQFNEAIETGLLVPYNFSIRGVLNNSPLSQSASVSFDGISSYMYLPESVSLNNKSFTIEFMLKSDDVSSGTILSQGIDTANSLEISFAQGEKLKIKIGSFTYEGQLLFTSSLPADAWHHYAIVFDAENKKLLAYQNGENIIDILNADLAYEGQGRIFIAQPSQDDQPYLNGNLSELRIWSVARLQPDIIANKSISLSGSEVGLFGYWQLDEANGNIGEDKASQRHATILADWAISGDRHSVSFDGSSQYIEMTTSNFAILPEMDYSIEFWFRNNVPSDTVCFFSCGRGDGNEDESFMEKNISICGLSTGSMVIFTKGNVLRVSDNALFDNQWHHFALVVTKEGNALTLIDGEVQNQYSSSLFASPAAANMYLGSRSSWLQSQPDIDLYYNGILDEFRFWNMSRTIEQIKMDMNAKLSGEEMGLIAYYPFENYVEDQFGQFNIMPTMNNMAIEYAGDPATFNVTESFSSLSPTIKDARPVQEISFDFTANYDKIIITPDASFVRFLENQIIEITVEGIEDKHGNMMASPKTWTAYVDKSQVKWQDKNLSFEKLVYEELSFSSSITNNSGLNVNYTIENLPNWLTANPLSGSIDPLETQEVLFTIGSGLNIGSYFEDIYLQTDLGFYEKLMLEVNVKNEEPDWDVTAANYQHSMNVIGVVKIEGMVSTDKNDMVAAFVGNEVRGKSNVSFIESINAYEVFLDIYSNVAAGEEIRFKVWDASKGHILDKVTPIVDFSANTLLGTPTSPIEIIVDESVQNQLELVQGWNWLSFNYESESLNTPITLLEQLSSTDMDQIKSQNSYLQYSPTLGWYGSLTSFNNTSMYMGMFGNDDKLIYSGLPLIPENHLINYLEGWNWIGYTPDIIQPINDAMSNYNASINDIIKNKHKFSIYVDGIGWIGSLQNMGPGEGYMLQSQQTGSFYFSDLNLNKKTTVLEFSNNDFSRYPFNMSVVARINFPDNPELFSSDNLSLSAYDNERLRGKVTCQYINGTNLYFLTVHGSNENSLISFAVESDENDRYSINEQINYTQDRVIGTIESPIELTITDYLSTINNVDNSINISCFPNPFSDIISFSINTERIQQADLSIYNSLGQMITTLYFGNIVSGSQTLYWDAREFPSGVYYCKLKSVDTIKTIKIIKTK